MPTQISIGRAAWQAVALLGLLVAMTFALTTDASANRSDCPSGKICLWSGPTFGEQQAFFEDTGCKPLNNIDPRSGFNNTNNRIFSLQQWPYATIWWGESWSNGSPYTGEICISYYP